MTLPATPLQQQAQDQQSQLAQQQAAAASRLVTASQVTGGNRPQLASILAQSGISDSDMQLVGGFAHATSLAAANALAADSGAQTNFTPDEASALAAIKEPTPKQPPAPADPRNWLEKAVDGVGGALSNTGNFLLNNPVSHGIEGALNWLGDAVHFPVRLLSAAIGGEDMQAKAAEMTALGYDPNSEVSRLAYTFSHGEGEYHNLNSVRASDPNGGTMVDLAVRMQTDPDGYQKWKQGLAADPNNQDKLAQLKQVNDLENSASFKNLYAAVDAQHISPGRDLAGLLTAPFGGKTENNAVFKFLSGALDAAYTWFADPTLVGMKLSAAVRGADVLGRALENGSRFENLVNNTLAQAPVFRAMRTGLQAITDQAGVRAALGVAEDGSRVATTRAGTFWQGALDTNKAWVQAAKDAQNMALPQAVRDAARAREGQLYNTLNQQYKAAIPLLPELNGTRVVVPDAAVRWNETGGLDHSATVAAAQARLDAGDITDDTYRAIVNGQTEVLKNVRAGATNQLAIVKDLANARPMEDLGELADYLSSTNGLLRFNGGLAAQQKILMPGRLSYTMMAKGAVAKKAAAVGQKFLDYTKPGKLLPDPSEAGATDLLHQAYSAQAIGDLDQAAQRGRDAYAMITRGTADSSPLALTGADSTGLTKSGAIAGVGLTGLDVARLARARTERIVRRLTSMQPGTKLIDLTDSNSVQQVRNFARFYMTKGDSDRLASSYAMGNLAQRRQILNGIVMQNLHASGVMQSEGGQAFADRFFADQASAGERKYGYGKSSQIVTKDNGTRDVAIVPSQLSDHVLIPSFRELHYAAGKFAVAGFASKVGLAGVRSAAESHTMDNLMHAIKLGWITTAASGLRNVIEESATAIAKGLGPRMLQGRVAWTQITQDQRKQLVDTSKTFQGWVSTYGRQEAERRRQEIIGRTLADGSATPAELQQASLLSRAISHRIPLAFRQATDSVNNVVVGSILGKALSYNKNLAITPEVIEHARELLDPELTSILKEGVHSAKTASGDIIGDPEAMDLHRAGLQARPYKFVGWRPDGWGEVEADGGAGIDAYSKYLGQLFNDRNSPAHVWTQTLKSSGGDIAAATRAVRGYMDDPRMAHFVNNGEILNTLSDGTKVAANDPQLLEQLRSQAKDEYANRLTDNMLQALGRRDGTIGPGKVLTAAAEDGTEHGIAPKLLNRLAKAQDLGAPDRQWLASELQTADLPSHVIQQRWAPYNQAHEPGKFPSGYTQMMTKAYQKLSVDQINALTRNPLTTGLYLQARQHLQPYEQHLLDSGWDADIAKTTAQRMALSHAQEEVFRHVDNPYVATQFATVARNFWAFERFQEDWVRRWGRTLRDNPELIRKAQLAIHGGQSTGMVEKDSQGNLTFVYPGSALAISVFNKAFSAMGLGAQVQIPIHGDLSSQLQFVNASLENPLGYASTPLVNIPFHIMSATVGADHPILTASLDKAVNGNLAQGKSWLEELMPSWANRIYSGVISQDPASKYGSAYANALFNAEAAGQLEQIDTTVDPVTGAKVEGGNATGIANFQRTLSTQVRNNLALEALFGFFAPAAPTLNENVTAAKGYQGQTPDFSAHMEGLQSLKDEAQQLLKTMPYDQFKAYWQATHPNELIYNQSGAGARTVVGSPGAYEPASLVAARWMQENAQFNHNYGGQGGLASYFLPAGQAGTTGGEFSDIAYRAELENGMRSYKPLEDIWKDIILQRGEDIYYRAKDAYDAGINHFDVLGQSELTKQQQQAWSQVRDAIYAGNPLLAQKFTSASANQDIRTQQVTQLANMLDDKSASTQKALGGLQPGIQALINNWTVYQQQLAQLQGTRFYATAHQTQQLNLQYDAATKAIAAEYPGLQGLINGVFRTPN